jgi:hypothetical protein
MSENDDYYEEDGYDCDYGGENIDEDIGQIAYSDAENYKH